jgi:hypothetical protein
MSSIKFMKRYIIAFSSKNVSKIVPFYSYPLTILDKNPYNKDPHIIINNQKQLKNYFGNLYKILIKMFNYKKTVIKKIKIIKDSSNYCVIEAYAARIDKENKVFNKIKILYFLKKNKNGYKINSFVV